MNLEASSDPLPYTQLDRAVKPIASRLATRLRIPYQHALGGLAEFWEVCGEPRALERLLEAGVREVVYPADDVMRRFRLGMGCDTTSLTPDELIDLGILEAHPKGYRVRGMSRYFKVVEARAVKRQAAAAGGKKSAEVRAAKYGTAQPSPPRSASGSGSASAGASESEAPATLFPEFSNQPPKQNRTQRSAVSGHPSFDRSGRAPLTNANAIWENLCETLQAHEVGVPEIHPRERNNRISTLLKQLPEPDGVLLDRVFFVALDSSEDLKSSDNPLAYLQTMLRDSTTKQRLLAEVESRVRAA